MNGHQHVMEGADDVDKTVEVEMMLRSTQVVLTLKDKGGSVKVTPSMYNTEHGMRGAYSVVEKVLDVIANGLEFGEAVIENYVLIMYFHKRGVPLVVLASEPYQFMNDALTTKKVVEGLVNELVGCHLILVKMNGERKHDG